MTKFTVDADKAREQLEQSGVDVHTVQSTTEKLARAEAERLEMTIKGAILAGYDGIDFNRSPMGLSLVDVNPWNRPEPDTDNGYRTERFTWDWFSEDELLRLMNDDEYLNEFLDKTE